VNGDRAKPGYPAFRPASYQVLGPEQDRALDRVIVTNPGVQTTTTPAVSFRVRTPNVRCRTRVSLFLLPDTLTAGDDPKTQLNTTVIAGAGTLWVAELDYSRSGVSSGAPTRNAVGTGAAPLAVPTDARLWGYSFEIETNGQELMGVFTPPNTAAAPASSSKWHLTVRYESVQRLTLEEWNQFLGQYGIVGGSDAGVATS
jgi:hypothetical protein